MRILIPTDAFPPVCGGSGWSTFELARALGGAGHAVTLVQPTFGVSSGSGVRVYDGLAVREFGTRVPAVPFVRNYVRNERLYVRLGRYLESLIRAERIDLVHAQHALTIPAAARAGRAAGVPVVATIRDYWPVCYWADLRYDAAGDRLCPRCSVANMTRCVRPHAGAVWPLTLPMIPYMRANLAGKRRALARVDRVVAVSRAMARDLRARAPELSAAPPTVIPNMVDIPALERAAAAAARPLAEPYVVYVGKLAPNKGSDLLLEAMARARLDWPLVVVGDGPDRDALARAFREVGRPVRFTGWLHRATLAPWLAHAALLVFPSRGPESLSRVLLEASALGVPVAAMDTGGTGDIIEHDRTGLLSHDAAELGDHVRRLADDPALGRRLGEAARRHAAATFAVPVVMRQIDALYRGLVADGATP